MPTNGIFSNTSAVLMYRDHGTRPMVPIHQQPISLFRCADLMFMAQGHLTFSASLSIVKPWRKADGFTMGSRTNVYAPYGHPLSFRPLLLLADLMLMPRMGILFLSDFFCYSQTDAYGTRPSVFMPTIGIFRNTSAARCVETVAQGRRSRHIKQPISLSAVRT